MSTTYEIVGVGGAPMDQQTANDTAMIYVADGAEVKVVPYNGGYKVRVTRDDDSTQGQGQPDLPPAADTPVAANGDNGSPEIAWGKRVSPEFKTKLCGIANQLMCDPNYLTSVMAFETGETFSPSDQNKDSKATGLIQFLPSTALSLGTTIDALKAMTAEQQLDFVQKYLSRYQGRMKSLSDTYMAVLYPAAVGQLESYVLFSRGSTAYSQNRGLDVNDDGTITKGEATSKVQDKLNRGLLDKNRG